MNIKNIIKKILLEESGEQLSIDFPEKLTVGVVLNKLKKYYNKPSSVKYYHKKGGDSGQQIQIPVYSTEVGEYPLIFRVDKFDETLPINVEYLGRSKKGKLYSKILNNMSKDEFLNFINSEPINYNFEYKVDPEINLSNSETKIKPIFLMLDRWLERQPDRRYRYSKYTYDKYKDQHLINKFFTDIYGIEPSNKEAISKLTNWYLRTKQFGKDKSIKDIDIDKHKKNLRKFDFEISKVNNPCDFTLSGSIMASDMEEAERFLKSGQKDRISDYYIKNLNCIDQFKYGDGDSLKKLKPGYVEDPWQYRWFMKK